MAPFDADTGITNSNYNIYNKRDKCDRDKYKHAHIIAFLKVTTKHPDNSIRTRTIPIPTLAELFWDLSTHA